MFAEDPADYDFYNVQCVKDLRLQALERDAGVAVLTFTPNPWKHDEGLSLTYSDVASIEFDDENTAADSRYGSLMLDEILPAEDGIEHELVLTSGTLRIKAGDVVATWGPSSSG